MMRRSSGRADGKVFYGQVLRNRVRPGAEGPARTEVCFPPCDRVG